MPRDILTPWKTSIEPAPVAMPKRVAPSGAYLLGRLRKIARMTMEECDFDDLDEAVSDCLLIAQEFLTQGIVPPDKFWIAALKRAGDRLKDEKRSATNFNADCLDDAWLYHLRASTPAVQETNIEARQEIQHVMGLPERYREIIIRRAGGASITGIAKDLMLAKTEVIARLKKAEDLLKQSRKERDAACPASLPPKYNRDTTER